MSEKVKKAEKQQPPRKYADTSVFEHWIDRRPLTEKEKARARELEPVARQVLDRAKDASESARGDNLVSKREPAKSTLNSGRGTRQSKDPREYRPDMLE